MTLSKDNVRRKIYTYLVIIIHFRSLSIRKSACVNVFFGSVQKISRLDSQSEFHMLTLFTVRHIEDQGGPPTWRLHTKLNNFVQNISRNISTLGQHKYLKRGKLSSLFIYLMMKITGRSIFKTTFRWFKVQGSRFQVRTFQ